MSGRCTVAYQADKHRVTRTKLLETCKTAETGFTTHSQVSWPADQLTRTWVSLHLAPALQLDLCVCPLQVLGVSRKSSSVTVFTLADGFIRSAVAEETHSLAVNAHRSAAAQVVSR